MPDRTALLLTNEADDVVNSLSRLYQLTGTAEVEHRLLYAIALAATAIARKLTENDKS
jgi:hypothetical protein